MEAGNASNVLKNLKNNNSDGMQDNCIIPTALPIFSRNSMKLFSILCGVSGSQKSKLADLKEEIPQHVYNIDEKFERQHPFFSFIRTKKALPHNKSITT